MLLEISRMIKGSTLRKYINIAHWVPLSIDSFMDIGEVILAVTEQFNDCAQELLLLYDDLVTLKPEIEDVLETLEAEPDQLTQFIKKLETAANSAKTDDTSLLKPAIVQYMLHDLIAPPNPAIPPTGSKAPRGFANPTTARLLCPIKKLGQFDADPGAFMDNVSQGTPGYEITAGDWPSFLYDTTIHNPDNVMEGFLRGYLLLCVYRHIFTSPSSSMTGSRDATKPAKAHIHKLEMVTGCTITYTAVQAHFALSSCARWDIKDGKFNLQSLFNNIVALFESAPKDPWVVETLNWWNEQLPDLKAPKKQKHAKKSKDANKTDNQDNKAANKMLRVLQAQAAK
ncbi:hypothetical protein C0991_005040, partial [Blastosporella zonata]